jgi:predicted MPP superfamily phosphohydrolase
MKPKQCLYKLLTGLGLIIILGLYSFGETFNFKINRITLKNAKISSKKTNDKKVDGEKVDEKNANKNKLTILHISDIHLWPKQSKKLKFIKKLNKQINSEKNIDLIISTGDNISSDQAITPLITALAQAGFDKIPGVFVFGSNDYYQPRMSNPLQYFFGPSSRKKNYTKKQKLDNARLKKGLEFLGWQFVEKKQIDMKINNINLSIAGGPDYHLPKNRQFYNSNYSNTNDSHHNYSRNNYSLKGNKSNSSKLNHLSLAVTHAPYLESLNYFLTKNVDYIFSGHTHGGQIALPKFGAFLTNSDLPRKYSKGVFKVKNSYICISEGLGTAAFFPFRFFCPPAISIIEIKG